MYSGVLFFVDPRNFACSSVFLMVDFCLHLTLIYTSDVLISFHSVVDYFFRTCYYSGVLFFFTCDPRPPTYTHPPTLQGFCADTHRFTLKCWWIVLVGRRPEIPLTKKMLLSSTPGLSKSRSLPPGTPRLSEWRASGSWCLQVRGRIGSSGGFLVEFSLPISREVPDKHLHSILLYQVRT